MAKPCDAIMQMPDVAFSGSKYKDATESIHLLHTYNMEGLKLKRKRPWHLCEHCDNELSHKLDFEQRTPFQK